MTSRPGELHAKLEPEAVLNGACNYYESAASIAISLKRIADMMEAYIRWNSGPEAMPK